MLIIEADNVNDAYPKGLTLINNLGFLTPSRGGQVLRLPGPVVTEYMHPQERVLFDERRDANPFFHLFEAIWMLGGRNDVKFPATFAKHIATFSDDGETLNGAYGHRWREHFGVDQINLAIAQLVKDPLDRRVVIGMWDPYIDQTIAEAGGKDVPCNTHVYFATNVVGELDMTVCNRSNDMVWGAYGANMVHMSILQEYVALCVGLPLGVYYQMSNNLHVYERHFDLVKAASTDLVGHDPYQGYGEVAVSPEPLFDRVGGETKFQFDRDVLSFLDDPGQLGNNYLTGFFKDTIDPMYKSWQLHKSGLHTSAMEKIEQVESSDWRLAGKLWLARRPPKVKTLSAL